MMEKIEWYQEVLEIEPSSKVFFPLAKLLLGNNQTQEAVVVLRQGLDRHPEFFEARLMLIDLLQQERDTSGALNEVRALGSKLASYPGFWDAWAQSVSDAGADKDMATALRLLAAFLRHSDLSWADIISSGLAALAGGPVEPPASQPLPEQAEQPVELEVAASEIPVVAMGSAPEELAPEPVEFFENVQDEIVDVSVDVPPPAPLQPEIPEEVAHEEDDGEDEHFSLRTRTMAAVLAEQGDYAGAKDIYEEILAATADPALRADLEGRIAELAGKIKSGHATASPDAVDENSDQGKNKLIQVLERLAGRLETRADKA